MGRLANYVATAVRNLARNKLYSAINLAGLGIGCTAALLIGTFVRDELSYEHWLPDYERIYSVAAANPGRPTYGVVPSDVGLWLKADIPQLEAVTRLFPAPAVLGDGDRRFNEVVTWADASVFDVFRFPVAAGQLAGALERPDGIVLTRKLALKYFGRADPIGATLPIDGHPMTVTAVIEDLPSNTTLSIDVLAAAHADFSPAALQDQTPLRTFGQKLWNSYTYVKLARGASIAAVRAAMPGLLDRHTPVPGPQPVSKVYVLMVRPIDELHLSSGVPGGPARDLSGVYTIAAIGVLILFAACVNFVNLMTALGTRRAVEVGVRRTAGARRRDLVAQFIGEAVLYVLAGALLALIAGSTLLAPLNAFLLRRMSFYPLTEPTFLVGTLAAVALLGVLAGLYPSVVLSAFRPATVFGASARASGSSKVRAVLVVVQFAIMIGLLIASAVIYQQMRFGTRDALARLPDPIVIINTDCSEALENELKALSAVQGVACSLQVPQLGIGPSTSGRIGDGERRPLAYTTVDVGFFELYGIELVAGRLFTDDRAGDLVPTDNVWSRPEAIVINERAARNYGFANPADAVGRLVTWNHVFALPATFTGPHDAQIIGVVHDFQVGSVRGRIPPAAFFVDRKLANVMSVRVHADDLPGALRAIDRAWATAGAPRPIQRKFFADDVARIYLKVARQAELLAIFAGVAVLIALLGLLGLVVFAAGRRTKEIGIRKTLGATRSQIVRLLLWQFLQPVLIANVIAWPLAYYAMSRWLDGFARHVELGPWVFVAAGAGTLSVSLLTVLAHAYTTAGTRPVNALRHE